MQTAEMFKTCGPQTEFGPQIALNPLKADLKPICHLLALLGVHHILHVSRIRINAVKLTLKKRASYI
jgi:hypothetical protein